MAVDATPDLSAFTAAISRAATSDAVWRALQQLCQTLAGCKLFTVMTVDMQAGLARRVFTNDTAHYPVSGTKPITRNRWFDIVHGEKRSFVANTLADIATVFPDHELIGSLGLGSVLNLPVLIGGELAATINMLDAEGHYTPKRVMAAERHLTPPAMLACLLAARFDSSAQKPD
jgi:hypothetical protein